MANRTVAITGTAFPTPMLWLSTSKAGPTVKPAALASLSAKLMARPRCRAKYIASAVGIAVMVHPAQPNAMMAAAPNNCHACSLRLNNAAPTPSRTVPAASSRPGPSHRKAALTRTMQAAPLNPNPHPKTAATKHAKTARQ